MHWTKLLFILHLIHIYGNNQTIVQTFYVIIIYTMYFLYSNQPLITVKSQVIEIGISRINCTHLVIKIMFDRTNLQPF